MSSNDDSPRAVATSVISAIAAAGNITLFASQIPLVYQLVTTDKDSSQYDWLPSVTLMTTMSLWCGYTVWILPTPQLFAANFTGIILPAIYLTLFAYYSPNTSSSSNSNSNNSNSSNNHVPLPPPQQQQFLLFNTRRWKIVGVSLLVLAVTWGFSAGVYASGTIENSTLVGGGVTAAVNCSFFVSPLRQLFRAVKELDLRRVPTLLSTVQFFQSIAWIVAASLLEDWFILGVNAAGFAFACLQLSVIAYVRYKQRKQQEGILAAAVIAVEDLKKKQEEGEEKEEKEGEDGKKKKGTDTATGANSSNSSNSGDSQMQNSSKSSSEAVAADEKNATIIAVAERL